MLAAANASIDELSNYIEAATEERRVEPRQDLISVLVEKEAEDALTLDEVIGFVILMLVAGNETTTNLIGNAAIALLDNSDQLAAIQAEPTLTPDLVEEALRYTSPVQLLFRETLREVQLGGVTLPAGRDRAAELRGGRIATRLASRTRTASTSSETHRATWRSGWGSTSASAPASPDWKPAWFSRDWCHGSRSCSVETRAFAGASRRSCAARRSSGSSPARA